jgi:aminopeptidase
VAERGSAYMNKVLANASPENLKKAGEEELRMVQQFTTNINICDDHDEAKIKLDQSDYKAAMRPSVNHRINNLRWLVVNAPSGQFAKACGMKPKEFDDFYLKVCLLDYKGMARAVMPLKELMDRTKNVRITGPDTNLTFSIDGLKSQPCVGERNIPDGECYTAPEKLSVNGYIAFGPSVYDGHRFSRIDLKYTDGYITDATAGNAEETAALNRILDRDAGARYTGEFAIAFNPHIDQLVGDILFDEKRKESIHIAQGQSYHGATYNGNDSSVHWDMVHSQSPKDGGGQIWFDDKLIRQDGRFVLPELEGLNPENLI